MEVLQTESIANFSAMLMGPYGILRILISPTFLLPTIGQHSPYP